MEEKKNKTVKESFYIDVKKMTQGLNAENEGDFEQAYTFYKQAADEGNPVAAFFIGNMYYYGRYGKREMIVFEKPIMPWDSLTQLEPDRVKAFEWFLKAAEGGYPDGMNNVGVMYHFGIGVKKDDEAAKHWLTKAANTGVKQAKQALKDFFEGVD